ncbi:hypothetical protein AB0F91_32520 [Amycolatopsis sp. NPDC023774]
MDYSRSTFVAAERAGAYSSSTMPRVAIFAGIPVQSCEHLGVHLVQHSS